MHTLRKYTMVCVDNFKNIFRESRKANRQSGLSWRKVTSGLDQGSSKIRSNTERELS